VYCEKNTGMYFTTLKCLYSKSTSNYTGNTWNRHQHVYRFCIGGGGGMMMMLLLGVFSVKKTKMKSRKKSWFVIF